MDVVVLLLWLLLFSYCSFCCEVIVAVVVQLLRLLLYSYCGCCCAVIVGFIE